MQIIYLAPFVLLAALNGFIFCLFPRTRRFALAAVVGPIAFAVCSILGLLAAFGVAVYLGPRLGLTEAPSSVVPQVLFVTFFYGGSGTAGTIVAVRAANKFQSRVVRWPSTP